MNKLILIAVLSAFAALSTAASAAIKPGHCETLHDFKASTRKVCDADKGNRASRERRKVDVHARALHHLGGSTDPQTYWNVQQNNGG